MQAALAQGADIVIQSTHKTLAALTQASMLHVQGSLVHQGRIFNALEILQAGADSTGPFVKQKCHAACFAELLSLLLLSFALPVMQPRQGEGRSEAFSCSDRHGLIFPIGGIVARGGQHNAQS